MNLLYKCRCDVSKESDWEAAWSHAENTFNGTIQILVNNAGINPVHGWKLCLDVMVYGVMLGSFLARDKMGKTKVDNKLIDKTHQNKVSDFKCYRRGKT